MTPRVPRGAVPAACLLVIALAVGWVRLPVYVERPLQPLELGTALRVDGRSAAELEGAYLVSLVGRRRASIATAVDAMLRETHRLRGAGEVLPADLGDGAESPDVDAGDQSRHPLFARSVDHAAAAALAALDRQVPRRVGGVQVVDVVDGSPADGRLRVRDVILSVDGEPAGVPSDVRRAVADAGGAVRLVVERDGGERTLRLRPAPFESAGGRRVGLGVVTVVAEPRLQLPVEVTLDAPQVRGPSAGLMVALAVTDLLGPGSLSGGRRLAGTGRVDPSGRVASVSGVPTKVRGAVAAGAEVFLVPRSQEAQAQRAAAGRLAVIGVSSVREAINALQRPDGVPAAQG